MNVKALGRYLLFQRESWGWTQDELAKRTGIKQRQISRLERGEIADPGFFDIARLAAEFGVNMEHMVSMSNHPIFDKEAAGQSGRATVRRSHGRRLHNRPGGH